jgi:anthranilate/para-aminobenzoate synthase component I
MFSGGWIGYFSYELGRYIEKVPQTAIDDLCMPLIRLCFYDRVICYDRAEACFWLVALELSDDEESPENKLSELAHLLESAQDERVTELPAADYDAIDVSCIKCNISKPYYLDAVGSIRRYIYDGDVYQVNFSQRFECDYDAPAVSLYHWENRFNPSPYAAYIDAGDFQIVSASPEMFITIDSGIISTKPIKGTRPRTSDGSRNLNDANFRELAASKKEQAELNMIIDLERNDLGRICEYGTIKVVQPRTIEEYPTVFHAVATIEGKLRPEITFCDILRAMFPGGSITGAPKIASMQIIDQLEPTQRGVYTGSIGFIGVDGTVCLNIAIRTIIIAAQRAYAQTGGGIVADSAPQAEWDETITKARALLTGIEAVQNSR